ncbi:MULTISPECIES: hypothetical protein [unclassified Microbacterium]|uniref:hypothetical protein n=1 Tax=unclassified Microbacterium TaxID=2609290 RepID=UPI0030174D7F
MSALTVIAPAEVPGEDVANPPFLPVRARAVSGVAWLASSAEFDGPLGHDGWPAATPEWEDLTPDEIVEHRSWCVDLCATCEGHRQFGYCPGCTASNAEAVDGTTVCCDQSVRFGDAAERAWVA